MCYQRTANRRRRRLLAAVRCCRRRRRCVGNGCGPPPARTVGGGDVRHMCLRVWGDGAVLRNNVCSIRGGGLTASAAPLPRRPPTIFFLLPSSFFLSFFLSLSSVYCHCRLSDWVRQYCKCDPPTAKIEIVSQGDLVYSVTGRRKRLTSPLLSPLLSGGDVTIKGHRDQSTDRRNKPTDALTRPHRPRLGRSRSAWTVRGGIALARARTRSARRSCSSSGPGAARGSCGPSSVAASEPIGPNHSPAPVRRRPGPRRGPACTAFSSGRTCRGR